MKWKLSALVHSWSKESWTPQDPSWVCTNPELTYHKQKQNTNEVETVYSCTFMKQRILNHPPKTPPEFVLTQNSFLHWPRTLPVPQDSTALTTTHHTLHTTLPLIFPNPIFLCILPELFCFMMGCLDHYSYPFPITTIFWETTSPPPMYSHLVLLSSLFTAYPPASNVLTLLIGLQEFPWPTQER